MTLKKKRNAEAPALRVGTVVPIRRQPQLIATDILRGGLVGRAADEIRKAFDVADILVLSPRAKPADRHVFDQSPA